MTDSEIRESSGTVFDGSQVFEEDVTEEELLITGDAVFFEDLEAGKLDISGKADVKGLVTCDRLNVGGTLKCGHNLVIETGEVGGNIDCFGKINAEKLAVYGEVSTMASAKINELDVGGTFTCAGKLRTEEISVLGIMNVTGAVYADDITFSSEGMSKIKSIDAENITVRKPVVIKQGEQKEDSFILSTALADCGRARISFTEIEKLICRKADIGPGCVIGELRCKEKPKISDKATVRKVVISEE